MNLSAVPSNHLNLGRQCAIFFAAFQGQRLSEHDALQFKGLMHYPLLQVRIYAIRLNGRSEGHGTDMRYLQEQFKIRNLVGMQSILKVGELFL
jgi:hypothetical protein